MDYCDSEQGKKVQNTIFCIGLSRNMSPWKTEALDTLKLFSQNWNV